MSIEKLKLLCDEIVFLYTPLNFMAIIQFYENFSQVDDEKVISIMDKFS